MTVSPPYAAGVPPPGPSLHDDLVATVAAFAAHDAETSARWGVRTRDPAATDRATVPSHFTASALPITPHGAEVCLVLHRRMDRWVQPGGHFEPSDRTVAAAAAREVREETGLDVVVEPVPLALSRHRAPCGPGRWHLDVQMLAVVDRSEPTVSAESHDVAWFPVGDLPDAVAPGVGELVRAAADRLGDLPPASRSARRGPRWREG